MKPKHCFLFSLHPPKSTETNETFLTGGSNKNHRQASHKTRFTKCYVCMNFSAGFSQGQNE